MGRGYLVLSIGLYVDGNRRMGAHCQVRVSFLRMRIKLLQGKTYKQGGKIRHSVKLDRRSGTVPDAVPTRQDGLSGRLDCLARRRREPDPSPQGVGKTLSAASRSLSSWAGRDSSYLAYSTERVSRITVTLIWPGYSRVSSTFLAISRDKAIAPKSSTTLGRTTIRTSRPAWIA